MTCRAGDTCIGTCYHKDHDDPIPMTGTVVGGSADDFTNAIPSAKTGDIALGNCGHTGIIIGSSASVVCDTMPAAKPGTPFIGDFTGIIVSGSPDTTIE